MVTSDQMRHGLGDLINRVLKNGERLM